MNPISIQAINTNTYPKLKDIPKGTFFNFSTINGTDSYLGCKLPQPRDTVEQQRANPTDQELCTVIFLDNHDGLRITTALRGGYHGVNPLKITKCDITVQQTGEELPIQDLPVGSFFIDHKGWDTINPRGDTARPQTILHLFYKTELKSPHYLYFYSAGGNFWYEESILSLAWAKADPIFVMPVNVTHMELIAKTQNLETT